jgi:hypothetical protein
MWCTTSARTRLACHPLALVENPVLPIFPAFAVVLALEPLPYFLLYMAF